MHNYNIEKDRFSTGKNAAIIRVVAPVQSCRSTSMAPALNEDHVIGSNEYKNWSKCKSVILQYGGQRGNQGVNFKSTLYVSVCCSKRAG